MSAKVLEYQSFQSQVQDTQTSKAELSGKWLTA